MKVLGRHIEIKLVSQEELNGLGNDCDLLGFFDGSSIYLLDSLPRDKLKRTLIHELTHAVLNFSGVDQLLRCRSEEAVCSSMENLLEVLQEEEVKKILS